MYCIDLCAEVAMAEISNESAQTETKLADIIHCSVCCGLLNDAKLLPCGHSYCLRCLEGLASKPDVGNADQLACPECRRNCAVPCAGRQSLPQNVCVDTLVQLKEMPREDRPGCGDERPLGDDGAEKEPRPTPVVAYSAETSVEGCAGAAQCVVTSAAAAAGEDWARKSGARSRVKCSRTDAGRRCDEHAERELGVYCRDCDLPMCESCFIARHNGHRPASVDHVADELRQLLRHDAEKMELISATDTTSLRALEDQRAAVLASVQVNCIASIACSDLLLPMFRGLCASTRHVSELC